MRYLFVLLLGITALGACDLVADKIEGKVESTFTEINQLFIDSSRVLASKNRILFDSINAQETTEWIQTSSSTIYFELRNHNRLIDSIQHLILDNSSSTKDRSVTSKYLTKGGLAKRIHDSKRFVAQLIADNTINTDFNEGVIKRIEPNTTGLSEAQYEEIFSSTPVYTSTTLLTTWKLENERCTELMLSKILAELEKAGMVKHNINRTSNAKLDYVSSLILENILRGHEYSLYTGIRRLNDTASVFALHLNSRDSLSIRYRLERQVNWKSKKNIEGVAILDLNSISNSPWEIERYDGNIGKAYRFIDPSLDCPIEIFISNSNNRKPAAVVKEICNGHSAALTPPLRYK